MIWRKFKLDWPYAIGELIIVTVGVLIALAIDQWNSDRLDRSEEVSILERLASDLEIDIDSFATGLKILEQKEASLNRVYSELFNTDSRPQDVRRFLDDVVRGSYYGWAQHRATRNTYDLLLATGKFSLIRNENLQLKISEYYSLASTSHTQINDRETQYPHISYQLAPRQNSRAREELDTQLTEDQISLLVAQAFDSSLRDHAIAEVNLARFTRARFLELLENCRILIAKIQGDVESTN